MSLLKSDEGVSEVVGIAIIFGLAIIGIAIIMAIAIPSIFNMEAMANIRDVEQSFALLDSHASGSLLGNSPTMAFNIKLEGGIMKVESNGTGSESFMTVSSDSFNLTIPMGKIKYTLGERAVAYEGGGVWSKYPSGSVMVSPPEFHFNGKTLTYPVISIMGNTSAGGKGVVNIYLEKNATRLLFPNASYNNRTNPVLGSRSGKIIVNITSEFYDAWAEYARNLGFVDARTDPTRKKAMIELLVVPAGLAAQGFSTSLTNPIDIRGINPNDPQPLHNFKMKLYPVGNSFNWDIRAQSGQANKKKLIFHITGNSKNLGDEVDIYVGYEDNADTSSNRGETWEGVRKIKTQMDGTNPYIILDLLNISINLTYKSTVVGATSSCTIGKVQSGFESNGFSWMPETFTAGTTNKSLYDLTQHYIQLMAAEGDISFNQCYPSGSTIPSTRSTLDLDFNATAGNTYLYVSDNIADVSIS